MASVKSGFGKTQRRAHLLALEPRMMFDAAAGAVIQNAMLAGSGSAHDVAAPDAHDVAAAHAPADTGFHDTHVVVPDDSSNAADRSTAAATGTTAPHDVIFIDTSVDDYQQLVTEWTGKGEIVLIDSTKDGIDQMRAALAGDTNIAAIHIVSHGSEGVLYLGTTRIDEATIEGDLAASLGAIGRSLNPGGDILLYGCDFAEGSDGARALAAFAQATHADVAASTDLTGYAGQGGDWVLEAHDGAIQAHALSSDDWQHTLDPNVPVPIAVTADSLTVKDANGNVIVTGSTGYVSSNGTDRSADVGAGATARWTDAATLADGTKVDLVATVVSISSGDSVRFNRPTTATNGDDPTFLLRDASNGNGTNGDGANVQILWQLVVNGTNTPIAANVEFGILDIDGVGGNPNTREAVSVPTANLAYYTAERATDIAIAPSLQQVAASGTQNENTVVGKPLDTKSEITFDWTKVSAFTINYSLAANNGVTTQAQFYQDGNADFKYSDPVYVSIPRLDLDANDSTATGNDAHFTFTTGTTGSPIVDSDVVVSNPMNADSVTGATLTLTNAQSGDVLNVGTLPSNITATVTNGSGTIAVMLSGAGSESDYDTALRAITFANPLSTPDTTQRVIDVNFTNGTLTSATAVSRIDINHAPVANPDSAATPEDYAKTVSVLANDTDADGDTLTVTTASAQHGQVVINADNTLTYIPDADYNGSDTIAYSISDGHGGTASSTVAMTVIPQPDPPVNHLPGAQSGTEDVAVVFSAANGNAVTVSDADGGNQTVTIAVAHGTLTLDTTSGLTFTTGDGTADATMTFTGTTAAINTALDGLRYNSSPDYNGMDALSVTTAHVPVEGVDYQNGGAEDPVLTPGSSSILDESQVPGWQTTASDHDIEIWSSGYNGVTAYEGNQFFEINANQAASLYQEFQSTAGSPIAVSFAHRGRLGTDVMQFTATDLGADGIYGTADDVVLYQQQYSDGNTAWGSYTAQVSGAASGDVVRLDFTSISTSSGNPSIGNFLDAVTVQQNHAATSASGTVSVALAPVADIMQDSATTPETTAVSIDALANDTFSDPTRAITAVDGQTISAGGAAVSVSHGQVALDGSNHLIFTPTGYYYGTTQFTYTVTAGGSTETATDTVTVTAVNHAPNDVGTLPAQSSQDASTVSYATAGAFTDVDGDTLAYSATGLPTGLSIDSASGVISGTIDRSASQVGGGAYDIAVTATDPSHASAVQHFTLSVTNPPPVAQNDSAVAHVDTATTIAVLANDRDPDGDPLTVTGATPQHGSVTINPDGTITYTPTTGYAGADTIAYTISDGQGGTSSATVAVTVANAAPTHTAIADQPASDGQAVSLPLASHFTDADGDPLAYSATGLPAGLSIDPVTGTITGTIDRSASQVAGGRYDSIVSVDDGHGGTDSASLHWTVTNPPPVAQDDMAVAHVDTAKVIAVLANDRDPDGDPLTVTSAVAQHGSVAINPDGTITYTPAAGFAGTDTIAYAISDGQGGTSSATVSVTVGNAAPTHTPIDPQPASDGQTVSLPLASYFADADGDPLTYSAAGLPAGLSIDPVTGIVSGTIDRSASQVAGGGYDSVVSVDDGHGGTDSAVVHWTVTNPAPVAQDDAATTPEDTAVIIPVLANDTDPDGDPLTVTSATAHHGSVAINPDGTITYTPGSLYRGTDSITYTISDGQGGVSTAHVAMTVTPVNHAPTAQPIATRSGTDSQPVTLDVGGFFGDVDGDALTYSATGLPPGLAIDPATGRIAGTTDHSASQGSVYHVVVTATDPSNASASSAFDWTIVNPAPVAADDTAVTPEDTRVTIPVLANDHDPDGDPLTVISATAQHGTVTINPDGTIDYVPGQYYRGNDVISYTIADGDGGQSSASVLVTVTPVDHAPIAIVAAPPAQIALEGNAVSIDATPWFTDVDGDVLTYSASGLPIGLSIDPASGAIAGIVDHEAAAQAPGANGLYTIAVTATDPSGMAAVSRFTMQVTNQAPVASDSVARTTEDTGVVLPALANARDPDGDPLAVTAATADHGSVTINPDGTIAYIPGPSFSGSDTVRYTVTDSDGATATAIVSVTVDHVNHAPVVPANDTPIPAVGGRPVRIDALAGVTDPDGDRPVIVAASSANGDVSVGPDGTIMFTPQLGFVGSATISYVVGDNKGGFTSSTFVVRVADGRGADIGELLEIGRVKFVDPSPGFVRIVVPDGIIRNPLTILDTVNRVRSLNDTSIGRQPVGDAVEAIRTLDGTYVDATHPITDEVARLDALRDQRDAGDRLFDHRWNDFLVKGMTGFSAASDTGACIMIDSVVRGGAIYIEVRDTAGDGASPIRSVDIRPANGAAADWNHVDRRGLAIIERGADMDELHLVVRVTRADGHASATPIVVQGATGEVELDRVVRISPIHHRAAPLDATLSTRHAATRADAARIDHIFK